MRLKMKTLIATMLVMMANNPAFAISNPLSGEYVLETTSCVGALNFGQGNLIPEGFESGATIKVTAGSKVLTLASSEDAVVYRIGTFDESGPVSDGQTSITNKYF